MPACALDKAVQVCQQLGVHPEIQLLLRLLSDAGRAPLCTCCLTRDVRLCEQFPFSSMTRGTTASLRMCLGNSWHKLCSKCRVSPYLRRQSSCVSRWHFPLLPVSLRIKSKARANLIQVSLFFFCKSAPSHVNAHLDNVYRYCAHSGTIKRTLTCTVSASLSVVDVGIVSSPRLCKD